MCIHAPLVALEQISVRAVQLKDLKMNTKVVCVLSLLAVASAQDPVCPPDICQRIDCKPPELMNCTAGIVRLGGPCGCCDSCAVAPTCPPDFCNNRDCIPRSMMNCPAGIVPNGGPCGCCDSCAVDPACPSDFCHTLDCRPRSMMNCPAGIVPNGGKCGCCDSCAVDPSEAALKTLMDEYYNWTMEEYPETATYYGVNTWNDRRESFNLTVYPRRKAVMDGFYHRLTMDINRADLSEEDQLNYDILEDTIRTYIDGYVWLMYGALNPMNFLEGEPRNPGFMARTFPLKTERDFEDYLSRLTKTKLQLEEYKALFREAIRLGRTLNAVSINRVPGQIDRMLVDDATQSVFYSPFNGTLTNMTAISSTKKQDLRSRAATIIQNNVLTPYRDLKLFLENEYIPATRTPYGVGALGGWNNGQAYYQACLKWHLSQEVTASEIHQKGLDEVARISAKMTDLMRKQGFQGTISEYFKQLKTNPAFSFPSAAAILQAHRDIIVQRAEPKLAEYFRNLPNLPIEVRALPNDGPVGSYSQGSEDGSRPGIFWVNVLRPNETYSFDMVALSAHEVNPGHHLQISYSLKIKVPPFRKNTPYNFFSVPFTFPSYTSYVEGWGLYAEALGEEMGLYKDDYELMGRYSLEVFRACRLVVDSGIHAFNWDKERAVQYMLNYTAFSRTDVEVEIDRYITWPGQACAYKFGELKIWELRRKAEERLGERFDIKEFHATVLDLGAVPLHILEKAVDDMTKTTSDTTIHLASTWTLVFSLLLPLLVLHPRK